MRRIIPLAVLALAACSTATPNNTAESTPAPPASPESCRNEALAQFSGEPQSEELGERMLRASGAKTLRWVPKGTMVTMEFNPERITVYLDESNRVERANCG